MLDEMQPYLFQLANSKRYSPDGVINAIRDLLNSGVIKRAMAANISLSQLGVFFSYVDGGDDIAKRNAELLRSAKIEINVKELLEYARNPFSQKTASDTVRVQGSRESEDSPKFRMAGGQTCSTMVGHSDIESLFVEVRIQLSTVGSQKQGEASHSETNDIAELRMLVDVVDTRVRKVFELADLIFKVTSLGWDLEYQFLEFPSQTPERTRSLYEYAVDTSDTDPVHDIVKVWNTIARHDSLLEKLDLAKKRFPFVSFVYPLDVMKERVRAMRTYTADSIDRIQLSNENSFTHARSWCCASLAEILKQSKCDFSNILFIITAPFVRVFCA